MAFANSLAAWALQFADKIVIIGYGMPTAEEAARATEGVPKRRIEPSMLTARLSPNFASSNSMSEKSLCFLVPILWDMFASNGTAALRAGGEPFSAQLLAFRLLVIA